MSTNISIKNRKASYEYSFLEKFTAGIQLTGTEIKSIRMGKDSLVDSYCFFVENELWVRGMHIAEYALASYNKHTPYRDRKLLLNRKELVRLKSMVYESGLTIVTTRLFINEKGFA